VGRGGKVGITLLVILLVLVGALVAIDRIAVGAAEDRIAEQAAKEMVARDIVTSGDPRASIAGFPFLTQVAAGRYQKITIDVGQLETNGVRLDSLSLTARTVHADTRAVMNGTGEVTADRVTGTATMGWDAVREALEVANLPGIDPSTVQVSVVNNQVEVLVPLPVSGAQATADAKGTVQLENGEIRVRITDFTVQGADVPPAVQYLADQIRDQLSVTLPVPAMPYQLTIDRVETTAAGVMITASADNVQLAG
jgi:hypothetical protein